MQKTIAIIVLCLMAAVMGAKHNDRKKNHHHKAAANVTVLGTKALGKSFAFQINFNSKLIFMKR